MTVSFFSGKGGRPNVKLVRCGCSEVEYQGINKNVKLLFLPAGSGDEENVRILTVSSASTRPSWISNIQLFSVYAYLWCILYVYSVL